MEMEAKFLIHFLGGLEHWAEAICPAIANRPQNTIDVHYGKIVNGCI
jgi:uridine phosphorylase